MSADVKLRYTLKTTKAKTVAAYPSDVPSTPMNPGTGLLKTPDPELPPTGRIADLTLLSIGNRGSS